MEFPILNPALLNAKTVEPSPSDDITVGKHGGNRQSAQANSIAAKSRTYRLQKVLEMALAAGADGITSYEIKTATGWLINTISSLLARMKRDRLLCEQERMVNGERKVLTRENENGAPCAVHVLPEFLRKNQ